MIATRPTTGPRTSLPFALCPGAGLRICSGCVRHVDRHPLAAANPHQARVTATRSERCGQWKAPPPPRVVAITPTDRRD